MLFNPAITSLPTLGFSGDEQLLITELHRQLVSERPWLQLDEAYYLGEQVVKNLRIAVPEQLEVLNTVLGWGAVAVDPHVEQLAIDGFRLPGGTEIDDTLDEICHLSGFDSVLSMCIQDSLVMRRGFLWTGMGLDGIPKVTAESPLNVAVKYASDGVTAIAALVTYKHRGAQRMALLQPYLNLTAECDDKGAWSLVSREPHSLPFVPLERFANKPATHFRDGRSEITTPMRSTIDSTARTLLNLEVSREIYSVPQKTILGAAETDFVNQDGTPKTAWDTYITRVLGLERDEDGQLPAIHQAQPYDPSVFTKLVETAASQFAGMAAAIPQEMGLYTQGNPTSGESYQQADKRRRARGALKQRHLGVPLARTAQHMIRFLNDGNLPPEYRRVSPDWVPLVEPNLATDADGLSKLITAGAIPATSDVTLKRAGFNAVDRAQLEMDRDADGMAALEQIAAGVNEQQQAAASSVDES